MDDSLQGQSQAGLSVLHPNNLYCLHALHPCLRRPESQSRAINYCSQPETHDVPAVYSCNGRW